MLPLYFGTQIQFVPSKELKLKEPKRKQLKSDYPWRIDGRVSLQKKGYTEGISNCNVLVVHNGERVTVAHLDPEVSLKEEKKVMKTLFSDIEQLKKDAKSPLRAFIMGGIAFEMETAENSSRLFELLKRVVEKTEIPHLTVIWGALTHELSWLGFSLFCDPKEDKILMASRAVSLDMNEIEQAFKVINVDKDDTFEVKEEPEFLESFKEGVSLIRSALSI